MPEQKIENVAIEVIADVLAACGLEEDVGDGEGGDYTLKVVEESTAREKPNFVLRVDVKEKGVADKLLGYEDKNFPVLQRFFFIALLATMKWKRIEQRVWLEVNGKRPDMRAGAADRNGNGGRENEAPPEKVVVTVSAPAGVEIRVKSE